MGNLFGTPTTWVFESVTPQPTYTIQAGETPAPAAEQTVTRAPTGEPNNQPVLNAGQGSPLHAAVSANGNLLAVATTGGVFLFDPAGLDASAVLHTSQQQTSLAFSDDGALVASGDWHGRVTVWDSGGNVRRELDAGRLPVLAAAFSPDALRLAASSWDGTIRVWRLDNGQLERTFGVRNRPVEALAFSEDGSLLYAWAQGESVQVWNAESGAARDDIYLGKDPLGYAPQQAVFGSRGRLLAVYYTRTVRVFVTRNGYTQMTLSDVTRPVLGLALSEDGSTLSVMLLAETGQIRINTYTVETGTPINRISMPDTGTAPRMALSPDGETLFTVSGLLQAWAVVADEDQSEPVASSGRQTFYQGMVLHARPGEQGQLYLVNSGGLIQQMDTASGEYADIAALLAETETGLYTAAALLPEEWAAFGDARGNVHLLAWRSGTTEPLQPHSGAVRSLAFSSDGTLLASGGDDGLVLVHDTAGGDGAITLEIGEPAVELAFHTPQGQDEPLLFVQTGSAIQLWTLEGRMLQQWAANAMTLSAQGDVLAAARGGVDGWVNVYHIPDGELVQHFSLEGYRLAFSPDGSVLAMGGADV
ncbi:MAG: hypothetical protein AAGU05_01475, partial [Anaerolineaceae bacterium]